MNRRRFMHVAAGAAAVPPMLTSSLAATSAPPCPNLDLRFGVTGSLSDIPVLAKAGFDYVDPSVTGIMRLSDADFAVARQTAAAAPIHAEAMQTFIPGNLKLVGPVVDQPAIDKYVAAALARAHALGVKVVVFGSGGARRVPDGFNYAEAWYQLCTFLRGVGDEIERRGYDMLIGIEALRRQECNIVNTTAQAYALSLDTNHPKIQIICDFYHMYSESESPEVLLSVKARLVHLHFANPAGRAFPRDPNECPGYAPFFAALNKIGYHGRLSIEARTRDLAADAPTALACLRTLYANACRAAQS
ncbi:MAG TPA: sugar phosphate isomerase/epimerase [Terriglobales bacterium]|jgi:sugar phosphate isomerase/epimerase